MEGPLKKYRELCQSGAIVQDTSQLVAIEKLQIFYNRLKQNDSHSGFSLLALPKRLFGDGEKNEFVGLYLYGGVGRGKSLLMDLFYEVCEVEKKWRVHFHAFMQEVHKKLKTIKESEGNKSSHHFIDLVAKEIAKESKLICFDEFYVADIVNAMILSKLFEALIREGVYFVMTSNFSPKDLYEDGLQREQFEPFIALLCQKFEIHHLDGEEDFRRQHNILSKAFIKADAKIAAVFFKHILKYISNDIVFNPLTIKIQARKVKIKKQTDSIVWFECEELAGQAKGVSEFEYYAKHYSLIFLLDIPNLIEKGKDFTRRFMNFIDVIYDAKIKLIFSSEYDIDELSVHEALEFEFARTKSRLLEMQDMNYAHDKYIEVATYYDSNH